MNELLEDLSDFLIIQLRGELLRQGHNFTGALAKSIEYQIRQETNITRITFMFNNYGLSLNDGIPASKIPYNRGSGKSSSKYIDGLRRWVRERLGFSQARAERVAFAIANAQKQKGYPLTGKIGWVDITLEQNSSEIEKRVEAWAEATLNDVIVTFVQNLN